MASHAEHPRLGPTGGLLRRLGRYALRRRAGIAAVLGTMLLKIAMDLMRPWPMKVLVDHVLQRKPVESGWLRHLIAALPGADTPQHLILWCVASTVVIFLLAWTLSAAAAMAGVNLGQRLAYDLAADLFARLQQLSLRFHARRAVGDSIRRVLVDSGCVSAIVKDAILPVMTSAVTLVVMFGVLWRLDARMAVVSLAVIPMMAWTFRRLARPMVETSYRQYEADANVYAVVERTLIAMPAVQAFCREADAVRELRTATDDTLTAALVATDVQLKFKVLIGLATATGTAGLLWLGAHEVLGGRLTVGELLIFLSYLASLYTPLEVMAYTSSTVQGAAGSARRVLEILESEDHLEQRPHARTLASATGHVRFESVTVGYEAGRPVLNGVSLEARSGQTIAIVGPTGAGKSTLVSLVARFADPWRGRVTLDGHDLRDLTLASLRRQVSLVLQEPFLFPLSIGDNIAYGRPGATRQAIEEAARAANAHEFIAALPEGYDTMVGERGYTLSGGERQRISIARALLKDAPVLILDEPTASLDARTESLVLEALHRLTRGRTTLVIAHRLSTVRNADRIVVVEAGRIVETGTHDALLVTGGRYAALHARQFAEVG